MTTREAKRIIQWKRKRRAERQFERDLNSRDLKRVRKAALRLGVPNEILYSNDEIDVMRRSFDKLMCSAAFAPTKGDKTNA